MDQLKNSSQEIGRTFLKSLDLDSTKKTIVVGSHWESKSLLISMGSRIIEKICQIGPEYNILVTGHGRLWHDTEGNKANKSLYTAIAKLTTQFPQLRFLPSIGNTTGLLHSADVFIGDNSSFFLENCLMDKPILFFDHPDFIFREPKVADRYKFSAFCFTDQSDVPALIKKALRTPNRHKVERKKSVDFFLARQGNSAQYISDLIVKMGRVCDPSSPRWQDLIALSVESLKDK